MLNSGSLRLLRIGRQTPIAVLDQIVKYKAVHRVADSRDLERRMAEDRRCYAFLHPALPDELLIFVEVALTHGMSANAQALLDPDSPTADLSTCDCATFYSISSARAAASLASLERSDWFEDADRSAELERQLVPLCAYYLLYVRRGDEPADPVARFHLRNGARLERINWLSDTRLQECSARPG